MAPIPPSFGGDWSLLLTFSPMAVDAIVSVPNSFYAFLRLVVTVNEAWQGRPGVNWVAARRGELTFNKVYSGEGAGDPGNVGAGRYAFSRLNHLEYLLSFHNEQTNSTPGNFSLQGGCIPVFD
jgi:hypothetical protein